MAQTVSNAALSDIIGAIYDCALMPDQWETVLDRIREEFRFVTAAIGVMPFAPAPGTIAIRRATNNISVGVNAATVDAVLATAGADFVALWGGFERVLSAPLDEPLIMSQISEPATWPQNAYYQQVAMPLDVFDSVGLCVDRNSYSLTYMGFGVHRSLGAVEAAGVSSLSLLSPHLRRAIVFSRLFELKAAEAATFADTIDALAAGVILVDSLGAVLHANPAAQALSACEDGIHWQGGQIGLDDPVAKTALDRSIWQAAQGGGGAEKGVAVPVRARSGAHYVIHVLPLGSERRRSLARQSAAMLFVTPANGERLPIDALTLLYDLTAAEARIFEYVYRGMTQAEIAAILGIAASTVKTHILHIFEKTGSRRQADIIRLGARFSLTA